MISPEKKQEVLRVARIEDVVAKYYDLKKSGASLYTTCPKCGKSGKGKGLIVTKSKQVYKCFSCDFAGNNAITFVMETQAIGFIDAVKQVAEMYNISLDERPEPKGPQKRGGNLPESFRNIQLRQSGLDENDQKATVFVADDTEKIVDTIVSGTRNDYGVITEDTGDDMIIWYYDLEGKPVEFLAPKHKKTEHLWRIRWQNPDIHCDKSGNPMKYSSPYGSGTHLYIPEILRKMYKEGRIIKRLYIQEGEKKSIKACKHGMPSVGIMGIHALGSHGQLPYDMQLIIKRYQVTEIIFVLDADWDELSHSIQTGSKVDSRPWSFFNAVKSYKEYIKGLVNGGFYLEIYFAHIKANEKKDKGIDDLLTNTLKGNEHELFEDFEKSINLKDGAGKYIDLHKITTTSDGKLMELWSLQSAESFAERYREQLEEIKEFKIGKHLWRFGENKKLELAQPLHDDEIFWSVVNNRDRSGNDKQTITFDYENAYNFLRNRGFGRIMMANGQYFFCHLDGKIVEIVEPFQVKDYVLEIMQEICPKDVRNMLYRGGRMYLGPESLGSLRYFIPEFAKANQTSQRLFFKNKYWQISAGGIEEKAITNLDYHVWRDKIIDFDATKLAEPIVKVEKRDGNFIIKFSKDGANCHFARFLFNSSEFNWRKFINPETREKIMDERTAEERFETNMHFVSKMTAIGYLLHKFRDKSCEKAVIAMDGKISEVGESNGRTGKSLLGFAIGQMIPQSYIPGKSKNLTEDPFIWEEVTEKTDNVFLDDVRTNIDFEFFFPIITGRITINVKGKKKFTLTDEQTPKLFLTTNHAINGDTSSFRDRQAIIVFSDFYNETHKPVDDFGTNFFVEWDKIQWNLFYNFMSDCLQLYFMARDNGWGQSGSGLVLPPIERIEMRRMRQFIGEDFLSWANEYFGISDFDSPEDLKQVNSANLNVPIPRQELFNNFLDKNPFHRKHTTAYRFKKKITTWCKFRGLLFNPLNFDNQGRPGADDKSGGVENLTISNGKY